MDVDVETRSTLLPMFQHAVSEVCPQYSNLLTTNINKLFLLVPLPHVQSTRKVSSIPTHNINAAVAKVIFWHVYRASRVSTAPAASSVTNKHVNKKKRTRQERDQANNDKSASPRTITIVSDYGTSSTVTARDLGARLLRAIPTELVSAASLADVRLSVGNSGNIQIVTMNHFRQQGCEGFVLCPTCGKFLRGEQGLWWHQKMIHGIHHTRAKEVAATQMSSMAVVPFKKSKLYHFPNSGEEEEQQHVSSMKGSEYTKTGVKGIRQGEFEGTRGKSSRIILAPGIEAAKSGNLVELRRLVEQEGFDAKTMNDRVHGSTSLLWAAGGGHLDVCKYLVEQCGADPMARQVGRRSFGGRTALHWSSRRGHLDVVQWLVDSCNVPIDSLTDDGTTPFCWSCWQGHLEVSKWLVQKGGCNPHAVNKYGCNATMWAVQGEADVKHLVLLRELGCSFLEHNVNGHGCMHKVAQRGKHEVAEWLCQEVPEMLKPEHFNRDGERFLPSGLAEVEGHVELAEWLKNIEKGVGAK